MTKKTYVKADGTPATTLAERHAIRFTHDDGTIQDFEPHRLTDDGRLAGMWHGFWQKIGDSYSGAGKAENPLAYAKEAVKDTIAQLYRGEWRATAEGGPRISDLAYALSRVTGQSVEECHAEVEAMSDDQKKVYRNKKKVAAALAAIAAEKAAEKAARLAAKAAEKAGDDEDDDEEVSLPGAAA